MLQFRSTDPAPRTGPLRPQDQRTVAVMTALGLVAMMGGWLWLGGWSGTREDIDEQEPRAAQFMVDVNTAEWPELALLPGVGETLAQRIVESRETAGPFRSVDELQRVNGIGPKTLAALSLHVTGFVSPAPNEENVGK